MQMLLESLVLHKQSWGEDIGKLKGSVEFTSPIGKMTVVIDPVKASRIIEIVAEELVAQAKVTAALMAAQVVEQVTPALEAPNA